MASALPCSLHSSSNWEVHLSSSRIKLKCENFTRKLIAQCVRYEFWPYFRGKIFCGGTHCIRRLTALAGSIVRWAKRKTHLTWAKNLETKTSSQSARTVQFTSNSHVQAFHHFIQLGETSPCTGILCDRSFLPPPFEVICSDLTLDSYSAVLQRTNSRKQMKNGRWRGLRIDCCS